MGTMVVAGQGVGVDFTGIIGSEARFEKLDIPDSLIQELAPDTVFENLDRLDVRNRYALVAWIQEKPIFFKGKTIDFSSDEVVGSADECWLGDALDDYFFETTGVRALAPLFAHKYGYPLKAFTSCSDYNGYQMLFCTATIPLPDGWGDSLSKMTREVYLQQINEFFGQLTDDEYAFDELQYCKAYNKI